MTYLCSVLMWFEALSGLKINLEKSELISFGNVSNVEVLAYELGCKVGCLPSTYLRMPLGVRFKSAIVWGGVEERYRKRLGMWKRYYISKGGRVTLIESTLTSIPIYCMSLFQMPKTMRLWLDQIQRNFQLGGGGGCCGCLKKKPQLVKWATMCWDKKFGGLGVKNMGDLNKALLDKWSWRFATKRGVMWNDV